MDVHQCTSAMEQQKQIAVQYHKVPMDFLLSSSALPGSTILAEPVPSWPTNTYVHLTSFMTLTQIAPSNSGGVNTGKTSESF